ncbi:MaoC/PaaZ C-terminal domain-containing protein [Acetobacterium wieringae]|uniref:MaoC/PaaZ C-terminal domain-containing protein n=1 Tax=Acetobacterium wieringae TaxID=52694 RepID=UPI002B1EFF3B|nr:MaoC/PaaZ C-terminal domain-containing protein [Acetobacterium wieringae]
MKERFEVSVTEEYVVAFRKNTGDVNPLHFDDKYASEKGYEKHLVFGMLTASYYSTLVGVYLPGRKCLIHSVNIKFTMPVYVDDELLIEGIVTERNDLFKILTIKAVITNQKNEIVSKATLKVGMI